MNKKEINKNILVTKGISSRVVENNIFLGHILLLDYDNMSKSKVLKNIAELDGVSILIESSEGSYHVWNLGIRTKDEVGVTQLQLWSDALHNAVSFQRDNWILRIASKDGDEGIYKSAPKLIDVFVDESTWPQSKPHLIILKEHLYPNSNKFKKIEKKNLEWVGNDCYIETYLTTTTELKMFLKGK